MLGWVYDQLLCEVDRRLAAWGTRRVVFIPHRGLHLLPLHACWTKTAAGRRYLIDRYEVVQAPSFTLLEICRERSARRAAVPRQLFAFADGTGDLPFAGAETTRIARRFKDAISTTSADDLARSRTASHLHFSCHGSYRFESPLESGLDLGDARSLSLDELFADGLPLAHAPQVVLSACESGVVSAEDLADEVLGIASGFLFAGASKVVSTLWPVNDLASLLLMERFYDYEVRANLDAAAALRKAQLWLRDAATAGRLCEFFRREGRRHGGKQTLADGVAQRLRRHFFFMPPDARPFAHPYDWAAFALNGT
jgi:CHAT domain-containing protein